MTPTYAWRLAKLTFKESIAQFFNLASAASRANRSISTFNKFEDEDLEIA